MNAGVTHEWVFFLCKKRLRKRRIEDVPAGKTAALSWERRDAVYCRFCFNDQAAHGGNYPRACVSCWPWRGAPSSLDNRSAAGL